MTSLFSAPLAEQRLQNCGRSPTPDANHGLRLSRNCHGTAAPASRLDERLNQTCPTDWIALGNSLGASLVQGESSHTLVTMP